MSKMRYNVVIVLVVIVASILSADRTSAQSSPAYQYSRQGVFDCNVYGGSAQNIGSQNAQGGIYVPVADYTTEQNTGILVYKECILREIVDRQREAAMASLLKRMYNSVQQGRNGDRQYVVNRGQEELTGVEDPTFLTFLRDGTLDTLNPTVKATVLPALARNYDAQTRAPERALACSYRGNLDAVLKGRETQGSVWDAILAAGDPACNPLTAYYLAQDLADARVGRALQYQRDEWNWGRGYYAVADANGNVMTPAVNVEESFQYMLNSPVRQLESANDIGQMVGALYAGVTTQIVSDSGGLSGLSQPAAGQPSYLDQVVSQSGEGLRSAAINAGTQILRGARSVEASYFQAINGIGKALTDAIRQLRSAENQCWDLIIPKVCTSPLAADNKCDAGGLTLKVATTTEFSQEVIDSQITTLASTTLQNIDTARQALELIDSLIQSLGAAASLEQQRIALQKVDQLVAQRKLHTQSDVQAAQQQLQSVQGAMATLVQDTIKKWADDPDASVGWCNINNTAVIDKWKNKWKQ